MVCCCASLKSCYAHLLSLLYFIWWMSFCYRCNSVTRAMSKQNSEKRYDTCLQLPTRAVWCITSSATDNALPMRQRTTRKTFPPLFCIQKQDWMSKIAKPSPSSMAHMTSPRSIVLPLKEVKDSLSPYTSSTAMPLIYWWGCKTSWLLKIKRFNVNVNQWVLLKQLNVNNSFWLWWLTNICMHHKRNSHISSCA